VCWIITQVQSFERRQRFARHGRPNSTYACRRDDFPPSVPRQPSRDVCTFTRRIYYFALEHRCYDLCLAVWIIHRDRSCRHTITSIGGRRLFATTTRFDIPHVLVLSGRYSSRYYRCDFDETHKEMPSHGVRLGAGKRRWRVNETATRITILPGPIHRFVWKHDAISS